jgi:hypothetical protein
MPAFIRAYVMNERVFAGYLLIVDFFVFVIITYGRNVAKYTKFS